MEGGFGGLRKGHFCLFDFVEVEWGFGPRRRLCGNWTVDELKGFHLRTKGGEARVAFSSDGSQERKGFALRVRDLFAVYLAMELQFVQPTSAFERA